MKKEGVQNPYQYDPCIRCGRPARRWKGGLGHCAECWADVRPRAQHGTESMYRTGCKCPLCREAARVGRARRRAA